MLRGDWNVVDGAELGSHETVRVGALLHKREVMIFLFHCIDSFLIFFTECFMFICMYAESRWLYVAMMSSLSHRDIINRHSFFSFPVVDDSFADVHRFVELFDLVLVAESRVHFLFDNGSHCILKLVCEWIQKCVLRILLLL